MTTKEKFLKLGKFIRDNYNVSEKEWIKIGRMKYYHNDDDFQSFQYFRIEVTVMYNAVQVDLPDHIDFSQFDPKILLRDLWKEATENLAPRIKLDAAYIDPILALWRSATSPITTVTVQEVADKFGVHVNNLRIKE